MNLSPSQKFNLFLEELGLSIDDYDNSEARQVISFLQNQVDGVSKVKMAIEALLPIENCLTDASDKDLKKFNLYKLWLMSHQILELSKLAQEYNAEQLQEILFQVARNGEALQTGQNEYGELYIIDFEAINNIGNKATIRSSWIVKNTENFPRLTSCYIL